MHAITDAAVASPPQESCGRLLEQCVSAPQHYSSICMSFLSPILLVIKCAHLHFGSFLLVCSVLPLLAGCCTRNALCRSLTPLCLYLRLSARYIRLQQASVIIRTAVWTDQGVANFFKFPLAENRTRISPVSRNCTHFPSVRNANISV